MSREQKLVDIMFSTVMKLTDLEVWERWTKFRSVEEKAAWIRKTLEDCGIKVTPMGSSHGVLDDDNSGLVTEMDAVLRQGDWPNLGMVRAWFLANRDRIVKGLGEE